MADQPVAPESSVEDRLASFFGAPPKATPNVPQAPIESDTQEPLEAEQSAELATEDQGTEEADGQQPDYEEIDWEGEKFQVPAKLKPALMMQSDYTRKTQEIAEVRKALEAEKFQLQANVHFTQQVQPLLQKQQELLSYKEQAKKIDWTQLTTDQKIDLDRELRNIDNQLGELNNSLGSQYEQHQANIGRAVTSAVMNTEQYMAQKVPGWNNSEGAKLRNYGLQLGIPEMKLNAGWFTDPVATEVMHKALKWDELQAGKPSVTNRASNAPPVVKPGSNAVQKSLQSSNFQKARQNLKRTGSIEDAAVALLRMRKR